MKRGKKLHDVVLKDYKYQNTNNDVHICAYGLFDTEKSTWKYHIVSYIVKKTIFKSTDMLVGDTSTRNFDEPQVFSARTIENYYPTKPTFEECIQYVDDYKIKWETGSNSVSQERRDKKLMEIL